MSGDLPVVPLNPQRAREAATAFLGMVIFISSWAMLFAGLFFAYGVIRARAAAWPPPDLPRLPLDMPGVGTLALVLSSAALHLASASIRADRRRLIAPALAAAAVLGALFLAIQIVVWRGLYLQGLRPDTGAYGSVFFGLTWFHGLHVAVGLVALAWLAVRATGGAYTPARHVPVRLWVLYWHMVGVVWLLMFTVVYLV